MKVAAKLLACSVGLFAAAQSHSQTNVVSDPVGFYKVTISPGANFVSAPLHKVHAYRGLVSTVVGNVVTFSGAPGFTASSFAPADGYSQYVALIKNDSNTNSPSSGNFQGDWWNVTANGTNSITLDPSQGAPTTFIGAGDRVELRKKTSLQDLFGHTNTTVILNKDNNGGPSAGEEDVIQFVSGTTFGAAVLYHDGTLTGGVQGYIIGNDGPYDGSTITIDPDEPIMVFRKSTPPGNTTTNIVSLGQVQTTRLTHYIGSGATTFATGFPAGAALNASNLRESGFLMDSNGGFSEAEEDYLRIVGGTSFGADIILHDGTLNASVVVWLVGGTPDDTFQLETGKGFVYFPKTATGGRTWRQNVPFTP